MKVLCIIPARSGSKSIKNKNLKKIKNKSLIDISINFAEKLNYIDKIIFSSDQKSYLAKAKREKIHLSLRPKKFSTDRSKILDLIKYEITREREIFANKYDAILLLQPTSPFRSKKDFKIAFDILKKDKADTVITVSEVLNHPDRMMVNSKNFLKPYSKNFSFKNKQELKKIYIRAGSMYFFKIKNIYKFNSILGKKIKGIVVKNKYAINIDSPNELKIAQNLRVSK